MKTLNISILFSGEVWNRCTVEYSVALIRNGDKLTKMCNLSRVHQNDPSYCDFNEIKFILDILECSKQSYDLIQINTKWHENCEKYEVNTHTKTFKTTVNWINSGKYKSMEDTQNGSLLEKLSKYNIEIIEGDMKEEDLIICRKMLPIAMQQLESGKSGVFILK